MFPGTCLLSLPPLFLFLPESFYYLHVVNFQISSQFLSCMTSTTAKRRQVTITNAVSTPQLTSFMLIYSSSWHVSSLGFNKAFSENGSSLTEGRVREGNADTEPKEIMEGQGFADHFLRHFITSTRASSARKGLVLRLGIWFSFHHSRFPFSSHIVTQKCFPPTGKAIPTQGVLTLIPAAQEPSWLCLCIHCGSSVWAPFTGLLLFPLIWIKHSCVLYLWYWTPCLDPDTALPVISVS